MDIMGMILIISPTKVIAQLETSIAVESHYYPQHDHLMSICLLVQLNDARKYKYKDSKHVHHHISNLHQIPFNSVWRFKTSSLFRLEICLKFHSTIACPCSVDDKSHGNGKEVKKWSETIALFTSQYSNLFLLYFMFGGPFQNPKSKKRQFCFSLSFSTRAAFNKTGKKHQNPEKKKF